MIESFTWERGPFEPCPSCGLETLGVLAAGGDSVTLRCKKCRYTQLDALPELDKRVVYLDQNAFSMLFKFEAGGRLPRGHEDFARRLSRLVRRVTLLQQVVLPHSDIHHNETTVFHSADALRAAYERLGGDVRLKDSRVVERLQISEFARAFIEKRAPQLSFRVDEVLANPRNRWLDDMHVHVSTDYSMFADGIRVNRDQAHQDLLGLAETWRKQRPTFHELLSRELRSLSERPHILQKIVRDLERAMKNEDDDLAFQLANHPILREYSMLADLFESVGVPTADVARNVVSFWNWEGNLELPHHKVASYLFAALGSRVVAGMRRITRGMMNDFRAIATYAPYVDAMFIDRECASLLEEKRLHQNLGLKARIFSFANGERFLDFLDNLERSTPDNVRAAAKRIYGVQ